jgi:hypothetical protein
MTVTHDDRVIDDRVVGRRLQQAATIVQRRRSTAVRVLNLNVHGTVASQRWWKRESERGFLMVMFCDGWDGFGDVVRLFEGGVVGMVQVGT